MGIIIIFAGTLGIQSITPRGMRMGTVREALHNVLEEASNNEWSEFDLAAACYAELRRYVVSDSLFLASYTQPAHMQITGDGVPSQNPNLAQLENLRSSFARTLIDMRNGRLRRADAYQAMWKGCESISLIPLNLTRSYAFIPVQVTVSPLRMGKATTPISLRLFTNPYAARLIIVAIF